jgi:hypothetical protein
MKHQTDHAKWRTLYRAGAVAPLLALTFYLIEFSLLIFGEPYPTNIEGWYTIVQRSKLLALWYLNALDILSFVLLGIMFLALYVALRRVRPAWMLIAVYLALLGVAVFVVPRVLHLSLLPLSDLHAAATSEVQRTMYLAAGEALSQVSSATPQTLGFLLMAAAGLIISVIVLRSSRLRPPIGRAAAYVGIVGFVVALVNYVSRLLAPDIATMVMPINGLLWFVWWILVSVGLFRLAKAISPPETGSAAG